jgi:hypothetical protein
MSKSFARLLGAVGRSACAERLRDRLIECTPLDGLLLDIDLQCLSVGDETVETCEERRYVMRSERVHHSV